jgi:fatty-acyl-CoA synthase
MSLVEALAGVAARGSGRGLVVLNGDREAERLRYAELYADAGHVACGLLKRGVMPGERVAIALPTSADFARAFFGVLAAGAVAVPVPPPFQFAAVNVHLRRIALTLRQSKVRFIISGGTLGDLLSAGLGADGEFTIVDVAAAPDSAATYVGLTEDDPALVQYTSGTVGDPKGVVLTHGNLLANVSAIAQGLDLTDADVCCSWLPLFHDMGLIGTLLCAALNDVQTYLLPPEDFLRDPGRWVRMISRYGGSIATAPSSGYLHTLRKVPAHAVRELDLSSWRLALNGAENVDTNVLRRFSEHFAPAGFRSGAFLPVYGLAEASLAVAFPPIGRQVKTTWVRRDLLREGAVAFTSAGAELARELTSVGTPVARTEIRLVDREQGIIPGEATIGEIQVRGASVMRGYEAHEVATRRAVSDCGWVSTGDLGFWHEDELFIAGRKKEMIIIYGQNHYASDIESIVGEVAGVPVHGALASSISTAEGEALVLFVETAETESAARSELAGRVRYAVSSALGVSPSDVFLVPKGQLPRTSSGKLQRNHGRRHRQPEPLSVTPRTHSDTSTRRKPHEHRTQSHRNRA